MVAGAAPVIEYRRAFRFGAPPESVWETLERTREYERWWGWLGEFRLDGAGLESGAVLIGVVSPPVPYRMRVRVRPSARVIVPLTCSTWRRSIRAGVLRLRWA